MTLPAAAEPALASVTVLPGASRKPSTPALMRSTDGEGVVLVTGRATDARQRTTIDLLSRRVAHRLGCPVTVAETTQGVAATRSAVDRLRARGAHRATVVSLLVPGRRPARGSAAQRTPTRPTPDVEGGSFVVRRAPALWSDSALVEASLEALGETERTCDSGTSIILAAPPLHPEVVRALDAHLTDLSAPTWANSRVISAPTSARARAVDALGDALGDMRASRALVVPMSIYPDTHYSRWQSAVSELPPSIEAEFVAISLHGTASIVRLICDRVVASRRT